MQLLQGDDLRLLLGDLRELLNVLQLSLLLGSLLLRLLLLTLVLRLGLRLRLLLLLLVSCSYGRSVLLLLGDLLLLVHLLGRLNRRRVLLLSLLLLLDLLLLVLLQDLLGRALGLRRRHNCRVEFIALWRNRIIGRVLVC